MPESSHIAKLAMLPLRVVQGIFAIIVLALAAYVASWWNGVADRTSSPSELNFLIFAAVWTLLALVYLILVPARFERSPANHKYGVLAAEAVTMIFWFAGFIAMAVFLTGRECRGSVCQAAEAATVFAAFEWVVFAVTTAFATLHVINTHGRNDRGKPDPNVNVQEGV